ncbi:MAG TPA: hypothetical protein VNX65_04700 [Patescibacteria group bacterium]|jgi:hypothetical protein|nr:hypothetical protein [Patescibacteria group bacterium]
MAERYIEHPAHDYSLLDRALLKLNTLSASVEAPEGAGRTQRIARKIGALALTPTGLVTSGMAIYSAIKFGTHLSPDMFDHLHFGGSGRGGARHIVTPETPIANPAAADTIKTPAAMTHPVQLVSEVTPEESHAASVKPVELPSIKEGEGIYDYTERAARENGAPKVRAIEIAHEAAFHDDKLVHDLVGADPRNYIAHHTASGNPHGEVIGFGHKGELTTKEKAVESNWLQRELSHRSGEQGSATGSQVTISNTQGSVDLQMPDGYTANLDGNTIHVHPKGGGNFEIGLGDNFIQRGRLSDNAQNAITEALSAHNLNPTMSITSKAEYHGYFFEEGQKPKDINKAGIIKYMLGPDAGKLQIGDHGSVIDVSNMKSWQDGKGPTHVDFIDGRGHAITMPIGSDGKLHPSGELRELVDRHKVYVRPFRLGDYGTIKVYATEVPVGEPANFSDTLNQPDHLARLAGVDVKITVTTDTSGGDLLGQSAAGQPSQTHPPSASGSSADGNFGTSNHAGKLSVPAVAAAVAGGVIAGGVAYVGIQNRESLKKGMKNAPGKLSGAYHAVKRAPKNLYHDIRGKAGEKVAQEASRIDTLSPEEQQRLKRAVSTFESLIEIEGPEKDNTILEVVNGKRAIDVYQYSSKVSQPGLNDYTFIRVQEDGLQSGSRITLTKEGLTRSIMEGKMRLSNR